ncbi:MAG: cytidine deaminase [Acidobacteriia bacterium]|nr:cytidine deaminase [Terriglobia bacterium]
MAQLFSNQFVNRRTALMTLISAGAALFAQGFPTVNASDNDVLANILPDVTAGSRAKLRTILSSPGFSGQIPAAAVQDLLASEKKNIAALMLALLPLARTFSHPPISNYHVGAVAQGMSGSLYLGFNIEFPGQALGFAVHGEQAALSSAYMHSEAGVSAIAVTAAPCGHCRQFMNELSPDGQIEIFVDQAAPTKLSALLPLAFGPKDLGRKDGAFPVKQTNLTSVAPASDALLQAALDAARTAYAPYTGACSGAAIATRSGRIYKGSYVENVAFNPSLSPLQTALVQMLVAGEDYSAISRVALAEIKGAKISQRTATEAVLSAIAPSVRVEFVAAETRS